MRRRNRRACAAAGNAATAVRDAHPKRASRAVDVDRTGPAVGVLDGVREQVVNDLIDRARIPPVEQIRRADLDVDLRDAELPQRAPDGVRHHPSRVDEPGTDHDVTVPVQVHQVGQQAIQPGDLVARLRQPVTQRFFDERAGFLLDEAQVHQRHRERRADLVRDRGRQPP